MGLLRQSSKKALGIRTSRRRRPRKTPRLSVVPISLPHKRKRSRAQRVVASLEYQMDPEHQEREALNIANRRIFHACFEGLHALHTQGDYLAASAHEAEWSALELSYDELEMLFSPKYLNVAALPKNRLFLDLGSGIGKSVIQAFLTQPKLQCAAGVELLPSRAVASFHASFKLMNILDTLRLTHFDGTSLGIADRERRFLHLMRGDISSTLNFVKKAGAVLANITPSEVSVNSTMEALCHLLRDLPEGCRLATPLHLEDSVWYADTNLEPLPGLQMVTDSGVTLKFYEVRSRRYGGSTTS